MTTQVLAQTMSYKERQAQRDLARRLKALKIERTGGFAMLVKACVLLGLFIGSFIFSFSITATWLTIGLFFVFQGFLKAFIGTAVMHDAAHGSFSKKLWVNKVFESSLYIVGGYLPNWKMQHNVIHHSFTNVHQHDEDIATGGLIRLSSDQGCKWFHRYQHIYSWFLYSLMTLLWITTKDFFQAVRYHKQNRQGFENISKHLFWITVSKLGYWFVWLGLPLMFWDASTSQVLVWFFGMELVAGLVLASIFQPAHVFEQTKMLNAPEATNFVQHQIQTSCDFATNSWLATHLFGGLNFQTVHHLYPTVSHVRYPVIARELMPSICEDYGVKYNNVGSFWDALKGHQRVLKKLGRG